MTQPTTCAVCNEPEPRAELLSECFGCGEPYHLNPYANRPGKDCGDVWIGEDQLTLQFFCQRCIGRPRREAAVEPPRAGSAPVRPESGVAQLLEGMQQLQGMLEASERPVASPPPPVRRRDAGARRRYRRID